MKPLKTLTKKTLTNTALSIVTILTMMSPVAVRAESKTTTTATISGDRSSSTMNTITSSSSCSGTQKVSGLDAQIFGQITPDHAGSIVCSKSDGFKTTAEGYSEIQKYHWSAWYKNKLEDDILEAGPYNGFKMSKIEAWEKYAENIKKLNGGKFPSKKTYKYPTDTKDGKLEFWTDIAGYYSVLGDPQYEKIHLTAYQQFSYRVEQTSTSYSIWTDPSYVPPMYNDGNVAVGNGEDDSGEGKETTIDKRPKPNPGKNCAPFMCSDGSKTPDNHYGTPGFNHYPSSTNPTNTNQGKPMNNSGVHSGGGQYDVQSTSQDYYLGNGQYQTVTTTVTSYDETKSVKVADANVAANAYATEIAAYNHITLKPGSLGTLTYDIDHSKVGQITQDYWVDGGKQTIVNQSSYPYSFVAESQKGSTSQNGSNSQGGSTSQNGSNSQSDKDKNGIDINLYGVIGKTDKLYNLIHGYPDITEVKDIPEKNGFPENTEKTCIETDKKICSDDKTPLIEVSIDIDEDKVQDNIEIKRVVHLVKDVK